MGMLMSLMGKGVPSISIVTDTLYKQFFDRNIKTFDDFHLAMLNFFTTCNAALPGMHYDAPPREVVEEYFEEWSKAAEEKEKQKQMFVEFVTKNVTQSTLDDATFMMGLVTPPAAMALKKAGENIPQLNLIRYVPDVIFIPAATLVTLVSMKLTRRVALKGKNTEEKTDTNDKT